MAGEHFGLVNHEPPTAGLKRLGGAGCHAWEVARAIAASAELSVTYMGQLAAVWL